MPELPEVEIIKRGLSAHLVGHIIQNIQILDPLRFTGPAKQIIGSSVINIKRRGKGLIINFENEYSLTIHVKMTGQLIYRGEKTNNLALSSKVKELPNHHTRVIFHLDRDAHLYYNDIRRFGWLKVVPSNSIGTIPFFNSLGPEPFETLTHEYFYSLLQKNKGPVKSVIMDQQKIAGIGNIYANDALYMAGIHPGKPAYSLTEQEAESLFNSIHEILRFSIEHGAASDTNYVDALGQDGRYQDHFLVYGRTGELCNKCSGIIKRIVIGGRGAFICEVCQR